MEKQEIIIKYLEEEFGIHNKNEFKKEVTHFNGIDIGLFTKDDGDEIESKINFFA